MKVEKAAGPEDSGSKGSSSIVNYNNARNRMQAQLASTLISATRSRKTSDQLSEPGRSRLSRGHVRNKQHRARTHRKRQTVRQQDDRHLSLAWLTTSRFLHGLRKSVHCRRFLRSVSVLVGWLRVWGCCLVCAVHARLLFCVDVALWHAFTAGWSATYQLQQTTARCRRPLCGYTPELGLVFIVMTDTVAPVEKVYRLGHFRLDVFRNMRRIVCRLG